MKCVRIGDKTVGDGHPCFISLEPGATHTGLESAKMMAEAAAKAGADAVKVFPANHFGPKYFKDLLAPMPHLKLTPTGGVNLDTAAEFIKAGAVTLGVGSALIKKDAIRAGDFGAIQSLAQQFVDLVATARAEMS